jgi:formylglycine-generating enzyme required for sulfatase activity
MSKQVWPAVVLALGLTATVAAPSPAGEKPKREDAVLKRFVDEFVHLTPGKGKFPASFRMGSGDDGLAAEQPAHTVTFTAPFAIARYEVTQELYEAIAGGNPSRWKGPRNSLEMVNWDEAVTFCKKATAALRQRKLLSEDEEIRLPTEAEWEYACRAGTTTRYSFGDDGKDLTDYGWYKDNAKGNDPPVGAKKGNSWGLFDMHGYVLEWCADGWHADYRGAPTDGSAWQGGKAGERVARGGAWTLPAEECRSAARHALAVDTRTAAVGFRCVRAAVVSSKKGAGDAGK